MLRCLSETQVAAFDSSEWEQRRFERWMSMDEIRTLLSPYVSAYPAAKFLDLGGGTGRFTDLLLATYESASAVVGDSSEVLLSRNQPHPRKTVLHVNASRLAAAFEPHSFDVIFIHRLLHHLVGDSYAETIRSIQEVLRQCAAILKPHGRLSVIENIWDGRFCDELSGRLLYHATSSRLFAPVARRMGANTAGTGVCYLSDRLLVRLLRQADFSVETQQILGVPWFPWYVRYPALLKRAQSVHYWCSVLRAQHRSLQAEYPAITQKQSTSQVRLGLDSSKGDLLPTIALVGPTPPPWFGQAVGMQVLLDAADLKSGYRLVHFNTNNVGKRPFRAVLSTVLFLFRYLYEFLVRKPAVVYLMVTRSKLGCIKDCLAMGFAQLCRVPVVAHLRGGDMAVFFQSLGPFRQHLLGCLYRRVTVGIVLGNSLRSQFDTLLPPERVRVVPNCWHNGDDKSPTHRQGRAAHDRLRITFLSNVLPSKGLYDALEGIAWAIRAGVKLHFYFAGGFLDHDGALAKLPDMAHENLPAKMLEEMYSRQVATLGIEDCVSRLGVTTNRRKWQLLAETDVLLLPIYNPTEGQPLVAVEAMRAGCAIISTECGGLADIVDDGVTGRVVPPRDPSEIGKAIKWFWDHPVELERIGRANRERAERSHSPREHVRCIRDIFDEILLSEGRCREASHVL